MNEEQWRQDASLNGPVTLEPEAETPIVPKPKRTRPWLWVLFAVLAVVAVLVLLLRLRNNSPQTGQDGSSDAKVQEVDLASVAPAASSFSVGENNRVVINGQLQATQSIVIVPSSQPANAALGQIYLDQTDNQLYYYNGTGFVQLGASVTTVNSITNISAAGVTSIQGVAGDVTLNGNNGISISGTTFTADSSVARLSTAGDNQVFTGTNQVFKNSTDNTNALRVQNAAGVNILTVDTVTPQLTLGTAGTQDGKLAITSITGGSVVLQPANTAGDFTITLPAESGTICTTAASLACTSVYQSSGSFVNLQATTPGTQQTGHVNVSGTVIAGTSVLTPLIDIPSAGTLSIGSGNASTIQVGAPNTASLLQTINIGTNAGASSTANVIIGAQTSTSTTTIRGGGGIQIGTGMTPSVTIQTASDIATAFQLKDADNVQIFAAGTLPTPNLINGGNFELASEVSNWTPKGSATVAHSTAQKYLGAGSMAVTTTATANDGATYPFGFSNGTEYSFTLYGRLASGTFTTFRIGHVDSGVDVDCQSNFFAPGAFNFSMSTSGWTQYDCTFTASNTTAIYVKQDGSPAARTFYIDNVGLQASGTGTHSAASGTISLNGQITSPLLVQPLEDSTSAFHVMASSGFNLFNVDTLNQQVIVTSSNSIALQSASYASHGIQGITIEPSSYGVQGFAFFQGGGVNGVGVNLPGVYGQAAGAISGLFQTTKTDGSNTNPTLVTRANTSQTANLFEAQNSASSPVFTVGVSGATAIQSTLDVSGAAAVGSGASPLNTTGLWVNPTINAQNCSSVIGCGGAIIQATETNSTAQGGVIALVTQVVKGAGTNGEALGVFISSSLEAGGGVITNNYGLYVKNQTAGNSDYGIYIEGADTYALFVDSGNARFDGNVEVQRTSTSALLITDDGGTGELLRADTQNNDLQIAADTTISFDDFSAFLVQTSVGTDIFTVNTLIPRVQIGGDILFSTGANRTISVETQTTSNTAGDNLTLQAATGNGTGTGGALALQGGAGGANGAGGNVNITGGAGAGFTSGGNILLTSGLGPLGGGHITLTSAGSGAELYLAAGQLFTTAGETRLVGITSTAAPNGAGGAVRIQGGSGGTQAHAGGALSLIGGVAGTSGNQNGGDVIISGGVKNASGTTGSVIVRSQTSNDSTTAFQVQNAANSPVLIVDTTNGEIELGGNLLPSAASTRDIGSSTLEFDELYLGDNNGIRFGLDQDATLAYDEATNDRVELTGTGASLFIEDRLSLGVQTLTLTDDGTANDTLTPTATYVRVDADETANVGIPDLTISETGAKDGQLLIIVNNEQDGNEDTFTITNSAGVIQLPGATNLTLGPNDSVTLMYMNDRWVTLAASNN